MEGDRGKSMNAPERTIELSGSESALVVAALFALSVWSFEVPSAKNMLTAKDRAEGDQVSEAVSARWTERLKAAGLWNMVGSSWTPELIAKRAAVKPGLVMRASELPLTILALDAVAMEFGGDWKELCIVLPGAIDWYPVGPEDLPKLARRLEGFLAE